MGVPPIYYQQNTRWEIPNNNIPPGTIQYPLPYPLPPNPAPQVYYQYQYVEAPVTILVDSLQPAKQ